jgi:hypothetical protein
VPIECAIWGNTHYFNHLLVLEHHFLANIKFLAKENGQYEPRSGDQVHTGAVNIYSIIAYW